MRSSAVAILKFHVYFSDSSLPAGVRDEFHGRMFSSCVCAPFNRWRKALDVFIVRFVLLLMHFQQRPQDFDVMLFLHHTLRVFKLTYNGTVSGCFHRFYRFLI